MSLLDRLDGLLAGTAQAASTPRGAQRLCQHLLATLLCPERGTLTNLLCTGGLQHQDWSAHYRCYSQRRIDTSVLFHQACHHLQQALRADAPLVVAMDDTLVRKRGTHIHGVSWRRDPLGPAFQTNLVRGQRYLQFSAAWPLSQGQARMLPIGFYHVPGAGKPARDADAAALAAHKEQCKQKSLNTQALGHMKGLRDSVPTQRRIVFNGDGSYTNKAVLRGLPQGSCYIGRMRTLTPPSWRLLTVNPSGSVRAARRLLPERDNHRCSLAIHCQPFGLNCIKPCARTNIYSAIKSALKLNGRCCARIRASSGEGRHARA